MLTPNAIRQEKQKILTQLRSGTISAPMAEISFRQDLLGLFAKVLHEIAHGSIDPKSLARAALEPEKKF